MERGQRGSTEEHLTVTQFKVAREQERLTALMEENAQMQSATVQLLQEKEEAEKKAKQAQEKLDDVAPKLKNIEHLAAEYSGDPERILPPVGKLESAASYWKKKVKPIFEKVVQLLRSVYHAYLDLKSKFDRLESTHKREIAKNNSLSERIYELCDERDKLLDEVKDFDRVKKAYGLERIAETIQAVKAQEQAQKSLRRHKNRDTR